MKNLKSITIIALAIFTLSSCNKNDDDVIQQPVNEEEVITTVTTTLVGGGQTITLTSRDLDGDGPNAPVITVSGNLIAGTTYLGSTQFLNELVSPTEDITEEVEEEGVDHQVFYQLASSLGTVTYEAADVDENGNPIGLNFSLFAGTSGTTGILTVTLRHEPNKTASNVSTGDITNAEGNTDAEVSFSITID